MKKPDIFTQFASAVATAMGHAWVFVAAFLALLAWAVSGPIFGFSDTWQLIINTSTTIITFLMVFIIQNTQNRDNMAMNIKLDAIMEKLAISEEELFKAEEESDKRLEQKKSRLQKELPRSKAKSNKK